MRVSDRGFTSIYPVYIFGLEKQLLSIAAYEVEQTHLDWQRMKTNAQAMLNSLQVSLDIFFIGCWKAKISKLYFVISYLEICEFLLDSIKLELSPVFYL